ncbi:biotin/lipoyl-binding protein [Xanthomonas hyacinthi]|nr:biotin/lipoyl-binding protein [Xanthomonas hyacinthi]
MSSLFRPESLEARENELLGRVRSSVPSSLRFIAAMASLLFLGVVVFVCFATYARKIEIQGYLAPVGGDMKVVAPSSGTLKAIYVKVGGDKVKKGDLLAVISSEITSEKTNQFQLLLRKALAAGRLNFQVQHLTERRVLRWEDSTVI